MTFLQDSDQQWERCAQNDPYDAVLRVKGRHAFFDSGFRHTERVWTIVQKQFSTNFRPQNAVDFGCGVGRVLVPLAKRCAHVIGVDVSETMLREAEENCRKAGIENHRLIPLSSIGEVK